MKGLPKKFKILFIIITAIAAFTMIYTLRYTQWTLSTVIDLVVFSAVAIGSESLPVALPNGGSVTVGFATFFAAIILFPSGVALTIATVGAFVILGKAGKDQQMFKRVFNGSQYIISLKVSAIILGLFGQINFSLSIKSLPIYFLVALTYSIVNMTSLALALGFISGKPPWDIWLSNIRWSIPNFIALAPLGLLLALIYKTYGPFGLLLLSVPLLLSRHSFQRYMDMRENYLSTIKALVRAIEAKDVYTSGHSDRVSQYSVEIAERLKLSEGKIEFIRFAAILHDVGKIGVSENILNKEGQLLDPEWDFVRNHPVIGQQIVKDIKFLYDIDKGVRHHHERYDGTGYPDGLKGEEIPLEARIIAVADSFDAMTSDRSYRTGRTANEAVQELVKGKETQFDPHIVDVFCEILPYIIDLKSESTSTTNASPQQECVS